MNESLFKFVKLKIESAQGTFFQRPPKRKRSAFGMLITSSKFPQSIYRASRCLWNCKRRTRSCSPSPQRNKMRSWFTMLAKACPSRSLHTISTFKTSTLRPHRYTRILPIYRRRSLLLANLEITTDRNAVTRYTIFHFYFGSKN